MSKILFSIFLLPLLSFAQMDMNSEFPFEAKLNTDKSINFYDTLEAEFNQAGSIEQKDFTGYHLGKCSTKVSKNTITDTIVANVNVLVTLGSENNGPLFPPEKRYIQNIALIEGDINLINYIYNQPTYAQTAIENLMKENSKSKVIGILENSGTTYQTTYQVSQLNNLLKVEESAKTEGSSFYSLFQFKKSKDGYILSKIIGSLDNKKTGKQTLETNCYFYEKLNFPESIH